MVWSTTTWEVGHGKIERQKKNHMKSRHTRTDPEETVSDSALKKRSHVLTPPPG